LKELSKENSELKNLTKADEKIKKQIYNISKTIWDGFVGDDFEVENGLLGLERDVYLSIIKFLNSSKVRKV
jgi:hypothetical protein